MTGDYQLVELKNGSQTLYSSRYGEKMHPGLGPQAEAEQLYVRQLRLCERMQRATDEFVVWDIGLGGAANAITLLRATAGIAGRLRLVSFDNTSEPLEFALNHSGPLNYLSGYEAPATELLRARRVNFANGQLAVNWQFHLADFPELLKTGGDNLKFIAPPHAIFFDAFSPAKNPAMWTLPVFQNLFRSLDPTRPCALTTYSRSTLIRATLLLSGFFVGTGLATGMKEETTIAANDLSLVEQPLDARWLERAARSDSAAPLLEPVYHREKLTPALLNALHGHSQFIGRK